MTIRWEHFAHGADIGIRGRGRTLPEAFAGAAQALTARQQVAVQCEAPEPDLLLVDWLNALVYEMSTRSMLFSRYEVECDGRRLSARAWGEPIDVERHQPAVEVKGATMTALDVHRDSNGDWIAQCVADV